MMDYFGSNSSNNERVLASIGLTASEIAILIIPILTGMITAMLVVRCVTGMQ